MFEDASRLAQILDHTLVKPDATFEDLERACAEAREYCFAALIVTGRHVTKAKAALAGTPVKVGCVVGFPHGSCTTTVKIVEAMEAMKNGVDELDIMINLGAVKSGRYDLLEIELKNVIAMTPKIVHKVILETGALSAEEITSICRIAVRTGTEFVKTCTGYGPRGVTVEDVRLLRELAGSLCRVKASGGVRDLAAVAALAEAGAERIGTSSGVSIMKEFLSGMRGA